MTKLPFGVDIDNLIYHKRIFQLAKEKADILLYYSKLLEDGGYTRNITILIMKKVTNVGRFKSPWINY